MRTMDLGLAPVPSTAEADLLGGRIAIAGGADHPCRVRMTAPDLALVVTAAPAKFGQDAVCYLDLLGVLVGKIGVTIPAGFQLLPSMNAIRRARVAARLAWHVDRKFLLIEQRIAARIVPWHRETTVRLPDKSVVEGVIVDLSKSGARIELAVPTMPPPGTEVTVGKRFGTVVRAENTSIAVCFRLPFTDATFNAALVL